MFDFLKRKDEVINLLETALGGALREPQGLQTLILTLPCDFHFPQVSNKTKQRSVTYDDFF